MSKRCFEPIDAYRNRAVLPSRKTVGSAGYDLAAAESVTIGPGQVALIPTGLKAYMHRDEVLLITIRSSLAVKKGLTLANGIGVIDADYVDNPQNEGHILIAVCNVRVEPVEIKSGERVAQAIFTKYLTTDDDDATGERHGGFGSTGT
jgi:dUTP pyrophosphatase